MKKLTKLVAATMAAAMMLMSTAGAIVISGEYLGPDPEVQAQINTYNQKKADAHEMAELARGLGFYEDHVIITEAQRIWSESHEQVLALQKNLYQDQDVTISWAPHVATGLSAKAFDKILEGTPMAGYGYAFENMEKTYGTNGLFAIGVAGSESTIGRHCYNNNPYGMMSSGGLIYYSDFGAATMAFGKLIASSTYAGCYDISDINAIYCPGDGGYWTSKVESVMSTVLNKLA